MALQERVAAQQAAARPQNIDLQRAVDAQRLWSLMLTGLPGLFPLNIPTLNTGNQVEITHPLYQKGWMDEWMGMGWNEKGNGRGKKEWGSIGNGADCCCCLYTFLVTNTTNMLSGKKVWIDGDERGVGGYTRVVGMNAFRILEQIRSG
uniref:SCP domain-containing protein n=1 Tax=Syphacia muris TaxID=451379 RepID=A0A0N5B0E8_9BILA